jgi:hypothetical protein
MHARNSKVVGRTGPSVPASHFRVLKMSMLLTLVSSSAALGNDIITMIMFTLMLTLQNSCP